MIFEIRERSQTSKECVFTYPKSELDQDYKAKLQSLQFDKTIQLKGYRPGKAPAHQIEKVYQHQIIQDLVFDRIQKCWEKAHQSFDVITQPVIQILPLNYQKKNEYTQDVEVQLSFQVNPTIELIAAKDLGVDFVSAQEPTAEEMSNYLSVLRHQFGQKAPVDREVRLNDEVSLNTYEPKTGKKEENLEIVVNEIETLSEFTAQITGLKVGEKKMISYKPFSYQNEMDGEEASADQSVIELEVEVVAVKEITPASDLQLMQSILELKDIKTDDPSVHINEWVKKTVADLNAQKSFRTNEKRLLQKLDSAYQFEIPAKYLEHVQGHSAEEQLKASHDIKIDLIIDAYRRSLGEFSVPNEWIDFMGKVYAQDHGISLQLLSMYLQALPQIKKDFESMLSRRLTLMKLLEVITGQPVVAYATSVETKKVAHDHQCDGHHHDHHCDHDHK